MKTKLRLHKETLRHLTQPAVSAAHGGLALGATNSCNATNCGTCTNGPTACGGCGTNTCSTCLHGGCACPQEPVTADSDISVTR